MWPGLEKYKYFFIAVEMSIFLLSNYFMVCSIILREKIVWRSYQKKKMRFYDISFENKILVIVLDL